MAVPNEEPRAAASRRLHRVYEEGRLRILVGAGTSVGAGFASWDTLNGELLRAQVATDIGGVDPTLAHTLRDKIPGIAAEVLKAIGRDAAAALVWDRTGTHFFSAFGEILYQGRDIPDLPILPIHYQLAAMPKAGIFTTNYDSLLELGLAKLLDNYEPAIDVGANVWRKYRRIFRGGNVTQSMNARICVCHVHGWVDPDGGYGGPFVLTEGQYFRLFENPASIVNRSLRAILTSRGAVLMVGMSIGDTNLRRILYQESSKKRDRPAPIYAVLRRGEELADAYQTLHWNRYGVDVLWIDDYNDIPGLLREVRYGPAADGKPLPWIGDARAWLESQVPTAIMFGDEWQRRAHSAMRELLAQIRLLFAVAGEEDLKISFLTPQSRSELAIVADTRGRRSGVNARERAGRFRLAIDAAKPQGVSGVAYVSGKEVEVLDDPQEADRNFSLAMRQIWYSRGYREWRSALAVPIVDSQHWVPVAIMTMTSNKGEPFWTRFGTAKGRYQPELFAAMRRTAKLLLSDMRSRPVG